MKRSPSAFFLSPVALSIAGLAFGCANTGSPSPEPSSASTTTSSSTDSVSSPTVTVQAPEATREQAALYTYKVVKTLPHDPNAFIQGFQFVDGYFYEGTGLEGQSTLRKVEVDTGKVVKQISIPSQYFGEGITVFKGRIYQITWQTHIGFVYDQNSFQKQKSFRYPTEGWGLTHDDQRLIMSDGSSTIYFWDPETLKEIGKIDVKDNGQPVPMLNELEYINGEIYANIWQSNYIVRIDPKSGKVLAWIDLNGILKPEEVPSGHIPDVLNGIAYDQKTDRLFVTGKLWPKIYEIKLVKKK